MQLAEFPRALTEREAATLEFMLSGDDPRLDHLREQSGYVTVVGRWDCCPTIDLEVDRDPSTPAMGLSTPAVETQTIDRTDENASMDLLLFAKDGWLTTLELVHYGDAVPREFPPTSLFERPSTR